MRKKLHQFAESHVDQVILLNQAGQTTHKAICDSLELFAQEVMPEFHAMRPAQEQWKADVLAGRVVLEDIATDNYNIYEHQRAEDARMTPEQLKQSMAEKEMAEKEQAAAR